jgi:hypothetical protein
MQYEGSSQCVQEPVLRPYLEPCEYGSHPHTLFLENLFLLSSLLRSLLLFTSSFPNVDDNVIEELNYTWRLKDLNIWGGMGENKLPNLAWN